MDRTSLLPLALAVVLPAQSLTAPAAPVAPGFPVGIALNSGSGYTNTISGPRIFLLHPEGELITPLYATRISGAAPMIPSNVLSTEFVTVPPAGPGSSGSFVLYFPLGQGAVARLDVGVPTADWPEIHVFPRMVHMGFGTHRAGFSFPLISAVWALANCGATTHVFTAGDSLEIRGSDGTAVLVTQSLAGIPVPAGGITEITLPIAGFAPAPYLVRIAWDDPVAGPTVRTHGVRPLSGADLHLPGGKSIPFGGSTTARVNLESAAATPPAFALAVGVAPGNSVLPGGMLLPLDFDALVLASLANGLSGLLTGNLGVAIGPVGPCFCMSPTAWVSGPIGISHPGIPALGGAQVRVAAVGVDSVSGTIRATQGELLTLQ